MVTAPPVVTTTSPPASARRGGVLSPLAARVLPGRRARPEERLLAAHAVPARPRPDRALEGVPAAQAQDAGLRRPRGRPLPHAADPHARGHPDLAHGRAGAAAQRGPHRGDRARPRRRPSAVRAHRRGGAGRAARASASAAASVTTSTRCGSSTCSRTAEPHRAGARRDPAPHGGAGTPRDLEGRIVQLVDRIAYINHDIDDARARRRARARDLPERTGAVRLRSLEHVDDPQRVLVVTEAAAEALAPRRRPAPPRRCARRADGRRRGRGRWPRPGPR